MAGGFAIIIMMYKALLYSYILIILFLGAEAQAGFIEIGASANGRLSTIDDNNYQESLSFT